MLGEVVGFQLRSRFDRFPYSSSPLRNLALIYEALRY